MAAQKVRLVADLMRGRKVADVRDILLYTLKDPAKRYGVKAVEPVA